MAAKYDKLFQYIIMDEDKELFDHYINLLITDSSISVCNTSDFSSYDVFANYLNNMVNGHLVDKQTRYLTPIIDDLELVYGMDRDECTKYVLVYFLDRKWERYYKAVHMIRGVFGKFLSL